MVYIYQSHDRTKLMRQEIFWRKHYHWLVECGYRLRPRYHPDWVASWIASGEDPMYCEDDYSSCVMVMDAVRISDGVQVAMKMITYSLSKHEEKIAAMFGQGPLSSDPRNHCIPLLEVLVVPDKPNIHLLVMPLARKIHLPPFGTVGEGIACIAQIFEGLRFMHENHAPHCDLQIFNIMMDHTKILPGGFSAAGYAWDMNQEWTGPVKPLSRTRNPTAYWIIDFGLSHAYDPDDPSSYNGALVDGRVMEVIDQSGDRSVPEYEGMWEPGPHKRGDPFAIDVYTAGNWVQTEFIEKYQCFNFLKPLVKKMTQREPTDRPSIVEAHEEFVRTVQRYAGRAATKHVTSYDMAVDEQRGLLRRKLLFKREHYLTGWKLRAHASRRGEIPGLEAWRALRQWPERLRLAFKRVPALPMPQRDEAQYEACNPVETILELPEGN